MIAFQQIVRQAGLVLLLPLAACTQYWGKPGASQAEFESTNSACETRAYTQFPPILHQVLIQGGYVAPVMTNCPGNGNAASCVTTGGQYRPPAYQTIDRNQNGRDSAIRSCLFAQGWRPVKDKAEAEAVNASAPAASPRLAPVK